jgi:hypothetical protein
MDARRTEVLKAAESVPLDVKAKWRLAFNEFDVMKNGVITAEELEQVMRTHLKMNPGVGEVQAMIAAVDHDQDSVVSYEEFELMMVAAGRGTATGQSVGFSKIVNKFIRQTDIALLITRECTGFVEIFCQKHRDTFADLVTPDVTQVEQSPAWYDTFKIFVEEAELNMQNVLLLWGAANMQSFDEDFLDAAMGTGLLHNFLSLTDYPYFIQKMHQTVNTVGDQHPAAYEGGIARPETPMNHGSTQQRLAALDRQLAMLDYQRNQVLAERRRLVGCEVQPVTTCALKRELEMRQWREDVGID